MRSSGSEKLSLTESTPEGSMSIRESISLSQPSIKSSTSVEEQPELRKLIDALARQPQTKVVSSCDAIIKMNSECPACVSPIPLIRKNLSEESKLLENFTDQQLNLIGLDKNLPEVVINTRTRKIQLILADPMKQPIDYSLPLDAFNLGELLYVAAHEKIPVNRIPDGYNRRPVLVALILYQRKRSDLIQNMMLSDEDIRTIVRVIESCGEIPYSVILTRPQLEEIIDTGLFPTCDEDFLVRWQRYETLKVLPPNFIQSLSYQVESRNLGMSPDESYIIAQLIDLPNNPFEVIFSKDRVITRDSVKAKYGVLVPPSWDTLDYLAISGKDYPPFIDSQEFLMEKLVSIPTYDCRKKYIERFTDVQIFSELKNYVSYNTREELIENVLTMMDDNGEIYFYSLLPGYEQNIFLGNYRAAQKLTGDDLIDKLEFISVQPYALEDRFEVLKQTRQLQDLLINRNLMSEDFALSMSKAITNLDGTVALRPYLDAFMILDPSDIADLRKTLYQRFYYAQTRNSLYVPFTPSDFYMMIPKLVNINTPNPNTLQAKEAQQIHQDGIYQSIALFKLLFGYIPNSKINDYSDRLAVAYKI
jgi:hypothetical protein